MPKNTKTITENAYSEYLSVVKNIIPTVKNIDMIVLCSLQIASKSYKTKYSRIELSFQLTYRLIHNRIHSPRKRVLLYESVKAILSNYPQPPTHTK